MEDIVALFNLESGHLPEPYSGLFEAFLEHVDEGTAMKLIVSTARHLGGDQPYFGTLKGLLSEARTKAILSDFNGYNHREMARKYGVTVKTIQNILKKHQNKRGNAQGSLQSL
jgi:Mor family transcriptional regulator